MINPSDQIFRTKVIDDPLTEGRLAADMVSERPRISIGIPLYRSARFLDNIVGNIESIQGAHLEFVLADHHQFDDAAAQLAERYSHDPRVRVIITRDELNWVENYNFLLHQMRGTYCRWLAHDDRLPPEGLNRQADMLDAQADAIGVCGPVDRVDLNGSRLGSIDAKRIRPVADDDAWRFRHCLGIFANWRYGGAFKALWRREQLLKHDLVIRPTHELVEPERVWLFAVALHGRILFDAEYPYRKQMDPESVSARWNVCWRHEWSYFRVGYEYLRNARGPAVAVATLPLLATLGLVVRPLRRMVQQRRKRRQR